MTVGIQYTLAHKAQKLVWKTQTILRLCIQKHSRKNSLTDVLEENTFYSTNVYAFSFYKHVYLCKPENLWAGAHTLEPRSVCFFHISKPQMQIMVPVRTFCSQQHTYDSIPRGNSWLMATVALNVFLLSLHTSSLPRCGALQQKEHC